VAVAAAAAAIRRAEGDLPPLMLVPMPNSLAAWWPAGGCRQAAGYPEDASALAGFLSRRKPLRGHQPAMHGNSPTAGYSGDHW